MIGTLKIDFEINLTLKTFNKSIEKSYYCSIYLLQNLMSSLVTAMQVLAGTQNRIACETEKTLLIGSFSVLRFRTIN